MRTIRRLIGDHAVARAASVAGCCLIAAAVMLPASSAVLADTMGGAEVQSLGISNGGHLISISVDGKVLTVVGTGRESLIPDTADVTLGVSMRGESASEVAQSAASAMAAVIAALTEAGIGEDAIQTTQLNLSPSTTMRPSRRRSWAGRPAT